MKLFTIGDSVSQGFMSGAAARTDLCYSILIARSMHLTGTDYVHSPHWGADGLPLNLEELLRSLAEKYDSDLAGLDWITVFPHIGRLIDQVEDYYERGDGAVDRPFGNAKYFHNVAVQGFDVADAWLIDPHLCKTEIAEGKHKGEDKDGRFALPNAAFYRTALKVLNPSLDPDFDQCSQLEWLKRHAASEGVENLILWLGANNALGTVMQLSIQQTPNDSDRALLHKSHSEREQWNLWHPNDFAAEYQELLDRVEEIMCSNQHEDWHVFIGTVPLVTIAPLTIGVGAPTVIDIEPDYEPDLEENDSIHKSSGKGGDKKAIRESIYYKYYTHFFRNEDAIVKTDRGYLTMFDVLHIDDCIRQYNRTIKALVEKKNQKLSKQRYRIVDISKGLQDIAFKRNAGKVQYKFPDYFDFCYPRVDTKYYHADAQERLRQGGLFSLDGVHPSAIGHGLIAFEFLKVMKEAGVVEHTDLDWPQIFASDTLYQKPIPIMRELYQNKRLAEFVIDRIAQGRFRARKKHQLADTASY